MLLLFSTLFGFIPVPDSFSLFLQHPRVVVNSLGLLKKE
jgi:hypothetical protein